MTLLNGLISCGVFQVSLKSLRVYDKYGVSEDPLQLQGQVRELKVQLENQAKVILQMQSLLRHNSLSSDLDLSTPDPSTVRDRKGRRTEEQSQEGVKKDGENTVMKDKTSHLSTELERERAQNRRVSEQLQQTSSGSTSPSRSGIFLIHCSAFTCKTFELFFSFFLGAFVVSCGQTGLSGAVTGQGAVTTPPADQGESQAGRPAASAAGGPQQGLQGAAAG